MGTILHNKRGLILGALNEQSLAWHVAKRCHEEGADIVLSNTEMALELGNLRELAASINTEIVACDATNLEDIRNLFTRAQALLGGKIDFILHAVAQSQNLRRHKDYENLSYDYLVKTIDTSAFSLHKLLQTAMDMDAISEGGSVVTLTYLASERFFQGYNDMADAKAMLESIVRQMGAIYGEKNGVRVNAVSQSATPTKAGGQWAEMEYFYRFTEDLSPLGLANADDCADLCVALFSDLTRKVTMQNIYNDGGYSRTMMTKKMEDRFKSLGK